MSLWFVFTKVLENSDASEWGTLYMTKQVDILFLSKPAIELNLLGKLCALDKLL